MRSTELLYRANYPRTLFFKEKFRFTLKNSVSDKFDRPKNEGCVGEMTTMLSCFKEKNYENSECFQEVEAFKKCTQQATFSSKELKDQLKTGVGVHESGTFPTEMVLDAFKRFPQPGVLTKCKPARRPPYISYSDQRYARRG